MPPLAAGIWNGRMAAPTGKCLSDNVGTGNDGAVFATSTSISPVSRFVSPAWAAASTRTLSFASAASVVPLQERLSVALVLPDAPPETLPTLRPATAGTGDELEARRADAACERGLVQRHRDCGPVQGRGGEDAGRGDGGARRLVVVHRHRHRGERGPAEEAPRADAPHPAVADGRHVVHPVGVARRRHRDGLRRAPVAAVEGDPLRQRRSGPCRWSRRGCCWRPRR